MQDVLQVASAGCNGASASDNGAGNLATLQKLQQKVADAKAATSAAASAAPATAPATAMAPAPALAEPGSLDGKFVDAPVTGASTGAGNLAD